MRMRHLQKVHINVQGAWHSPNMPLIMLHEETASIEYYKLTTAAIG